MACAFAVSLLMVIFPLMCVSENSGSAEESPDFGELRLVGGRDEREGIVEIFLDEEWGTICGDLWEDTQTKVVCRQLGFYQEGQMVLTITHNPEFFSNQSEGPIHMDAVLCKKDELMLVNCTHSPAGKHCTHSKDVGVVCPGNCNYGDVQLVDGMDEYEGRVEVCVRGLWGTICDNHWDTKEAIVVCKQLGIEGNTRAIGVGAAYFGHGRDPILMDKVSCEGTEENITECKHKREHNCQHSEDVGVFCNGGKNECTDSEVRLVEGRNEREGVVQVCYSGLWGAICDTFDVPDDYGPDRWHIELDSTAEVICRQLGYLRPNTSAVIIRGYLSSEIDVPLLLEHNKLDCKGTEKKLSECGGYVIGEHLCSEPKRAIIICPENCTEGDAQLVGGRDSSEGRVEVCLLGHWIGVCSERWSNKEAEVVCQQLNYYSPNSIAVAVDGYYFGIPQRSPFLHATCSSNEAGLYACHSEIDQCDPIENAGVICEVDCENEETLMLLEDNNAGSMCHQSTSIESEMTAVLAGTITPLVLTIALLVVILTLLLLKMRTKSPRQLLSKHTSPLQNSSSTSKTDLAPEICNSQKTEQFLHSSQTATHNRIALIDIKNPEASLPHVYESLRGGQKLWLSSPRGSDLDILEEERGAAAANCNDTVFNSVGSSHPYAVLEAEQDVRCEFATTADSLPSLLAPSSLDHDASADVSAMSSAEAVLNFDTNPLPLPPKYEHNRAQGTKASKKDGFVHNFSESNFESSMYDRLQQKAPLSTSKQNTLMCEDRLTLSLKPEVKKTKGHGPASMQRKRLHSK